VLWLEEHVHMPPAERAATLEHRSGLFGLAGTADMRAILAAESEGDEAAALAIGVYLHRLRASVAAMVAALGGLDVLVFTGGVGENAPAIRARLAAEMAYLGIIVDSQANERVRGDTDITDLRAAVTTLVVEAREDLEVVRQVRAVLTGRSSPPGS
jgi:acetate kinase